LRHKAPYVFYLPVREESVASFFLDFYKLFPRPEARQTALAVHRDSLQLFHVWIDEIDICRLVGKVLFGKRLLNVLVGEGGQEPVHAEPRVGRLLFFHVLDAAVIGKGLFALPHQEE
jgi:hypothetical protein